MSVSNVMLHHHSWARLWSLSLLVMSISLDTQGIGKTRGTSMATLFCCDISGQRQHPILLFDSSSRVAFVVATLLFNFLSSLSIDAIVAKVGYRYGSKGDVEVVKRCSETKLS